VSRSVIVCVLNNLYFSSKAKTLEMFSSIITKIVRCVPIQKLTKNKLMLRTIHWIVTTCPTLPYF